MTYGIGKNSTNLVIIGKLFQATKFMYLCYYVLFMFRFVPDKQNIITKFNLYLLYIFLLVTEDNNSLNQLPYQLLQIMLIRLTLS